jgi:molybdate transport system substrate-binding protein
MRVLTKTLLISASLTLLAGMALAADLRVLAVEEVQEAVQALAAEFQKDTGQGLALTIDTPAALMQKLKAGEVFDALVASEHTMDELDREGMVNPESRVPLARAEVHTVYEGALMSDGAEPEASRAFIRFLADAGARSHWINARLEPLADH